MSELNGATKMVSFGAALRAARATGKLTLRELGEMAGLDGSSLGHYETGKIKPSVQTYDRLLALIPALAEAPKPRGMRNFPNGVPTGSKKAAPTASSAAVVTPYARAIEEVKAARARLKAAIARADAAHRKMMDGMAEV